MGDPPDAWPGFVELDSGAGLKLDWPAGFPRTEPQILTPLPGRGARDPRFDRMAGEAVEFDDMVRGLHDRGIDESRIRQVAGQIADTAASWPQLRRLLRQQLYGSHLVGNRRAAVLLIETAVSLFRRRHPDGDPDFPWLFAFDLEHEYEQREVETRRAQVGELARALEQREELEYQEFLRELEYMQNLPALMQRMRVMQVDPRLIKSSIFRASGAAKPIYDALQALKEALGWVSLALDFVPIVGQVKGIAEAIIGRDLLTGDKLPTWARGLSGALALLPFAKGAFGAVRAGTRAASRGASYGMKSLAALADHTSRTVRKLDPRELFKAMKGLSRVSEESLRVASRLQPGRAITVAEKQAVSELSRALEVVEAGRNPLSRTASGVIEEGRILSRTQSGAIVPKVAEPLARTVARTTSKAAQSLLARGYLPDAVEALERLGVRVTQKLAGQLTALGDTGRDFLNLFHRSKGFHRVIADVARGGNKAEGAGFVMRYATKNPDILAKVRADPALIAFEWGAGIKKTQRFGDVFAREVDIVVRGDARLGLSETIYNELKNWTAKTLKAAKAKKLPQQFVRDLALLDPATIGRTGLPESIRWVFNSSKIANKREIIDVFVEIIGRDAYLTKRWGTDAPKIRAALERLIQLYP